MVKFLCAWSLQGSRVFSCSAKLLGTRGILIAPAKASLRKTRLWVRSSKKLYASSTFLGKTVAQDAVVGWLVRQGWQSEEVLPNSRPTCRAAPACGHDVLLFERITCRRRRITHTAGPLSPSRIDLWDSRDFPHGFNGSCVSPDKSVSVLPLLPRILCEVAAHVFTFLLGGLLNVMFLPRDKHNPPTAVRGQSSKFFNLRQLMHFPGAPL
jgi:hypothetical protein